MDPFFLCLMRGWDSISKNLAFSPCMWLAEQKKENMTTLCNSKLFFAVVWLATSKSKNLLSITLHTDMGIERKSVNSYHHHFPPPSFNPPSVPTLCKPTDSIVRPGYKSRGCIHYHNYREISYFCFSNFLIHQSPKSMSLHGSDSALSIWTCKRHNTHCNF